jgi:deoxyribonuclease IV
LTGQSTEPSPFDRNADKATNNSKVSKKEEKIFLPAQRSIGIHVSISKRLDLAVDRALELGCVGTFQIFTCSPRRWAAKEIDPEEASAFVEKTRSSNYDAFAHMPYMPNIASPDKSFHSQSILVLIREIERCSQLGIQNLVVHFGSHQGTSLEEGQERVVEACLGAIEKTAKAKVRILLETSAGTRNSLGSKFEYIGSVLERIGEKNRMGACFDTCHVFASGYDLRTKDAVAMTLDLFDKAVGLNRLYLIHVNDSKVGLGEARDRHEHVGLGKIGDNGFRALFSYDKIRNVPLNLETPIDGVRGDKENVSHAKKLLKAA